ncbi:MAG: S8 family serine peptidase [Proteobacteria bacterium]|nr:S8 family serine peptidase [Pseudomonadota bacterium]
MAGFRHALLGGLAAAGCAAAGGAWAQSHVQIEQKTKPQIAAVEAAKAERTAPQTKVASSLLDAAKQANTGAVNRKAPALKAKAAAPDQLVDITIQTRAPLPPAELVDALTNDLHAAKVTPSQNFPKIEATVPLSAVEEIAKRGDVAQVHKAEKAVRHVAPWALEGRIAHRADDDSLKGLTASGKGVTVCVISDSLDNPAGARSQAVVDGALPAGVRPLDGEDGAGTESQTGEGLAMLEVIHAIAPAAELWFATGNGGASHMADNILALQAKANCQVMVDDVTYPSESPFQDDDISIAVSRVSDKGVLYFSSARNGGSRKHNTASTWEGMFEDGGKADPRWGGPGARIHVFGVNKAGKTINKKVTFDTIDKLAGDGVASLFWNDPLGGSANGYDLFLVNDNGDVIDSSTTSQTGGQNPYQTIEGLHQGLSLVIVKEANAQPRFLHLDIAGAGASKLRYGTDGSVRGHNASGAANAFSIAARGVAKPPVAFAAGAAARVEDFSSDGPRRVFFRPDGTPYTPGDFSAKGGAVRRKPDFTAANRVTTTLPPGDLNPFQGTSAAAPYAAAIAALILSCEPARFTPATVRQALRESAIAIEGPKWNENAGEGVLMARAALDAACKTAGGAAACCVS